MPHENAIRGRQDSVETDSFYAETSSRDPFCGFLHSSGAFVSAVCAPRLQVGIKTTSWGVPVNTDLARRLMLFFSRSLVHNVAPYTAALLPTKRHSPAVFTAHTFVTLPCSHVKGGQTNSPLLRDTAIPYCFFITAFPSPERRIISTSPLWPFPCRHQNANLSQSKPYISIVPCNSKPRPSILTDGAILSQNIRSPALYPDAPALPSERFQKTCARLQWHMQY